MEFDRAKLTEFLSTCTDRDRIYVGCDSERLRVGKQFFVDYILVVVVHVNGCNGARIWHTVVREPSYDINRKDRQTFRLMNEAYKLGEFYIDIQDLIKDYEVEIHLDYNASPKFLSNAVVGQALGYIRAITGLEPKIKDVAWAASYAADRAKELATLNQKPIKMPGHPEREKIRA